jgi:tetratricopeptide (TPR) repeat protein
VKNSYIRLAALLGMVIVTALPARPQTAEIPVWRIRLQSESGESLSRYSGELLDRFHQRMASAEIGFDSAFEFRQVPCGEYLLVVHDATGAAVHQEFVSATASQQDQTILLPKKNVSQPPVGPVSVTELRNPPSPKAVQAALAGQKFVRSGEFEKAAQQFQKATDIAPSYSQAFSLLAASHLRTGNYQAAANEASRAMELSQSNPVDLCNLTQAQFHLGQIAEATATARRWLAIAPENPKAHWILGLLLARDRRTLSEAALHLERAAQEVPEARPHWEAVRQALAASGAAGGLMGQEKPD